jgi:AraC-like DNA-binding protein
LYYISVTGWTFAQRSGVDFERIKQREQAMEKSATTKTPFPKAEMEARKTALLQFFDTQQPWLDPELTLSQLAAQTGMNASQLSFLLNTGFEKNFNDFVNSYRVAAVEAQKNNPAYAHLSLLGIAFECGFNSKATFNRAFKKITGRTPSA